MTNVPRWPGAPATLARRASEGSSLLSLGISLTGDKIPRLRVGLTNNPGYSSFVVHSGGGEISGVGTEPGFGRPLPCTRLMQRTLMSFSHSI